ncbi:MAG: hypothetical protein K8R02_05000 [Anaerohalosphaeraceae bacterium]|nr:hypothetical protein [Anaerohalosphaeraceae bacterium]
MKKQVKQPIFIAIVVSLLLFLVFPANAAFFEGFEDTGCFDLEAPGGIGATVTTNSDSQDGLRSTEISFIGQSLGQTVKIRQKLGAVVNFEGLAMSFWSNPVYASRVNSVYITLIDTSGKAEVWRWWTGFQTAGWRKKEWTQGQQGTANTYSRDSEFDPTEVCEMSFRVKSKDSISGQSVKVRWDDFQAKPSSLTPPRLFVEDNIYGVVESAKQIGQTQILGDNVTPGSGQKVIYAGKADNPDMPPMGDGYETDFEDFSTGSIDNQDGWDVITTNGIITTDSRWVISGSKSLIVYYGAGNAEVTKSFTSAAVVEVEFDTGDCNTGKRARFRINDSSGNVGPDVEFSTNGKISAYNGSTKVDLMSYEDYDTNKKSYHFRIVADTASQTYDFYVDGVRRADNYNFYGTTGSELSKFNIKRYTSSKLILDNLEISVSGGIDEAWLGSEGFIIGNHDDDKVVTAVENAGVLYGLMELRDLITDEGYSVLNGDIDIMDRPVFSKRLGELCRRANFELFWASEKSTTPIFRYDDNPEIFDDVSSSYKADYLADVEANRDDLRDAIDKGADYGVKIYISTFQPSMPEFGIDAFIDENPECEPSRQTQEWHPAICPSRSASKDMLYDKIKELFEDVDDLGGMVLCMGEGWQSIYSCGCSSCGSESSVTLYRNRLVEYIGIIRDAMLDGSGKSASHPDAPKVYLRPWQIVEHGLGDNTANFISLPSYLPSDVHYYSKITSPPGSDYLWSDIWNPYLNMPRMLTFGWNICHPHTTEPCLAQLCYTAQKFKNRAVTLANLGSVIGGPRVYGPSADILYEPGRLASQKIAWDPYSFDPIEYLENWATEKFGSSAGSNVADALEDTYKITDAFVTLYPENTHWFHMLNFDRDNDVHCWARANDMTQTSAVKNVSTSTLSSVLSDFNITEARTIADNAMAKLALAKTALPSNDDVGKLWRMAHATEALTDFYRKYHYALVYNNLYENTGTQSYRTTAKTWISSADSDMRLYVDDMYLLYPEIDEHFNNINDSFQKDQTSPKSMAYVFGQMSSLHQQCQNGYHRLVMKDLQTSQYPNKQWQVYNTDPEIGYDRYSPWSSDGDWENIYDDLMTEWQASSYTMNASNGDDLPAIISPWILPTLYINFTADLSDGGMLVIKFVPLGGKNRNKGSMMRRSIQKIYIDDTYVKTLTDIGTDDTREDGDYTRYIELPAKGTGSQSHQLKIRSKPDTNPECLGTEYYWMKLYTASAGSLYQTDFEDFSTGSIDNQDGWDVITTNGIITTDSRWVISGSKSLIVYYGAGNAEVTKSFTSAAVVEVEFDTGDCNTGKRARFRINDSSGNVGPDVEFSTNGKISAYNGSTKVDLMSYEDYDTNKKSYHFRIVADTASQTYDFYVDGVRRADNYNFYGTTGSELSKFNIKRYTSSKLILDNLEISQ